MSDTAEEVMDALYNIFEPHSGYIRREKDHDVRYFIPPEILEALVWVALNISLPILIGFTTSVLADRFKKKDDKELKAMELQKAELERLKTEVQQALKELDTKQRPNKESILIARASLTDVLRINGWPSEIAEADAEKAVIQIQHMLWTEAKED
jgi:hypothetical protein